MSLQETISAAWSRRAALHASSELDVYRVFHGWAEGSPGGDADPGPGSDLGFGPGLEIDRYGDTIVITCWREVEPCVPAVAEVLHACARAERFAIARVVVRPRRGEPYVLGGGAAARELIVHEHGLRFLIDPARPGNPGLFLDARPARAWIRAHSRDRRVLNLFAFTGSLGVAAAAGGARRVVHVDSGRSALDTCRTNHELNGLPVDDRDLARINVYQHLRRQQAGRQPFDAIIMDPPPLSRLALRTDRTPGGRGLVALAPLAARMLEPGGWLLCFFHHDARSHGELEREVQAAAGIPLDVLWRGESGPDFPAADPGRKLRLTAFCRV